MPQPVPSGGWPTTDSRLGGGPFCSHIFIDRVLCMSRVIDLTPGDKIRENGAVFITQARHPLWPHLQLVVWNMAPGIWTFDALSPSQEVGDLVLSTPQERTRRVSDILTPHRAQERARNGG